MAIDPSIPTSSGDHAAPVGATDNLRLLLVLYADVVRTVDDGPAVLWARFDGRPFLHWLRFPAACPMVRILVLRHIARRISALRRAAARRVATAEKLRPSTELERLERFEHSLPMATPSALIALLVLLPALFLAYLMANSRTESLLGNLTAATAQIDPGRAIDAFKETHLALNEYFQAVTVTAWSLALAIVPIIFASNVAQRVLARTLDLEARSISALNCRTVDDVQYDLCMQLLLTLPVGAIGAAVPIVDYQLPVDQRTTLVSWAVGAGIVAVTLVAVAELRSQHGLRRTGLPRRTSRVSRACLWVVTRASIVFLILLSFA